MNRDKKNILKGVFYGLTGTVFCMLLLGTMKPSMEVETGVNVETGESVVLIHSQEAQPSSSSNFNIGRYQLSTWSSGRRDGVGDYGAFLIDTATGRTKIIYSSFFTKQGKEHVRVNNLNKPFEGIVP